MTDAVYGPTRLFCDTALKRLGIETTYYDPVDRRAALPISSARKRASSIARCPGSQTMDVQDVPAIAAAAHAAGCLVVLDNTWSGGRYFNAFAHGCDVSIQAATKYLVGHSDAMLGTITASEAVWPLIKEGYETLGQFAGPDDMYSGAAEGSGRSTSGSSDTGRVRYKLRLGSGTVRRLQKSSTRRCLVRAGTRCGSAISPAPAACSRSFCSPSPRLRSLRCSTALNCSEWAIPGAVMKASSCPSRSHRSVQDWGWAGPCLRFHIGLEDTRTIFWPISTQDLRACATPLEFPKRLAI